MTSILSLKENIVDIKCNLDIDELKVIKQFVTQPHGSSVVGLTVLDVKNRGMDLTLKFDNAILLKTFITRMIDVWNNYKPIKSYIRSFKENGSFLEEYMDKKLSTETHTPHHIDEFHGNDVIIDFDFTENNYKFTIFRWSEPVRHLYCYAVVENISQITNNLRSVTGE